MRRRLHVQTVQSVKAVRQGFLTRHFSLIKAPCLAYFWRLRFCKEVVGPIAETLSEMRPIKYSEILEFDRKIREFDSPPFDFSQDDKADYFNIQGHLWNIYRDIGMCVGRLHDCLF